MACLPHHVARRSASEGRQDEVRADRAAPRPVRFFMNHETRNTDGTAVRFAVRAQGSHNRKPPPGPPNPLPSHCFPARHCPLLPTIARYFPVKNIAPEPVSAHRPPFSVGLTTSAVSWEILQNCAESRFSRKNARSAAFAAAPVALRARPAAVDANGREWTRMDTQLPPPQQQRPSFVLIRVYSW